MSNKKTRLIAAGCVLVGVLVAMTGVQLAQNPRYWFLNTGLFSVSSTEIAYFHVTLDDRRGAPSAKAILQFYDGNGAVVASTDYVTLLAGQTLTLRKQGPGVIRAHAEVIDSATQASPRRAVVGTVEVISITTGEVRPIPSLDPHQVPGGID